MSNKHVELSWSSSSCPSRLQLSVSSSSMEAQQHHPATDSSASVDTVEASIEGLLTRWQRRQRWQHLLRCFQPQEEEDGHIERAPWRTRLANFLESNTIHIITLVLLLIDLIFTVHDLSSSLVSCSRHKEPSERTALSHWGGIAILSVLVARTVALVLALGWSFFRRPGRVVDGLVVVVALLLEILAKEEGSGLLVVVSLWRVVRVVESAFELSDESIQAQIERILSQFESLSAENKKLQEEIRVKDQRIAQLEEALARQEQARL